MKKYLALVLAAAVVLGATSAWSEPSFSKVGFSGMQFLKIGAGARASAMGGAFTAVADDATALYWNPAGIARMRNISATFAHTNWFVDINNEYIGCVFPGGLLGNFGISASFLSMGDMQRTTIDDITTLAREDEGEGLPTFSSSDLALGLTYARSLTNKFSVGFTAKYVREKIAEMSASQLAFDVGTHYLTGFKTLRIGMAIVNYSGDAKFSGIDLQRDWADTSWPTNYTGNPWEIQSQPFPMPLQFKIGAAYDFKFGRDHLMTTTAEMIHPNDGNEKVLVGLEYGWRNPIVELAIRGGYKYDPDWYETKGGMDNMSAGMGISRRFGTSRISLDYAYTNMGFLDNVHRFSLGLGF